MPRFKTIVSRRREEDEIPTARVAIRNHCLECCGYSLKEVSLCTAPKCWLYPWRENRTPAELKKKHKLGQGFARKTGFSAANCHDFPGSEGLTLPKGTNGR